MKQHITTLVLLTDGGYVDWQMCRQGGPLASSRVSTRIRFLKVLHILSLHADPVLKVIVYPLLRETAPSLHVHD